MAMMGVGICVRYEIRFSELDGEDHRYHDLGP